MSKTKISISDLASVGLELFDDPETFLHELTNEEICNCYGGWKIYSIKIPKSRVVTKVTVTIAYSIITRSYHTKNTTPTFQSVIGIL